MDDESVAVLARTLREHHDTQDGTPHQLARVAREVADGLGLDPMAATEVEIVALLHEAGRETLDPEGVVETAGMERLEPLLAATHERWDGSGAPEGLAGSEIPLEARIVRCADAFDALTTDRVRREPLDPEEACERIAARAGSDFDPLVVGTLVGVVGA